MGKRILLLEKERNLAHFLSLELQKEQYRVDQVEEGQKALSMALQTDYDLILLNAHLGDMTAQDFADKLSRTKPASVLSLIHISATTSMTNFDILKRLNRLEKEVFGKQILDNSDL